MPPPQPDNENKQYPEKIEKLVDQISSLTLMEVADLNQLLKKRLNIPDAPMGGMMMAAAPAKQVK
jgi:large subunit ribosomal protein L7/L12